MTSSLPERKKLGRSLVILLALLGVSVFINYVDRGNLSIAAPMLQDELHLAPDRLGLLLSAFFWTYALLQPIYGWLVDRLNVYWLFAGCFALWSIATASTALVHTFAVLFILRLCVGLGEAVSFPSYSKIIALNYGEEHRGLANGVVGAGLALGPGFGVLVGGTLMAHFGWRPFFIALGLGSFLWLPLWIKFMPSKNVVAPSGVQSSPSLLQFLSLRSAWGSCIGLFSGNYVNYFLLTWLPYYLVRERHFSMVEMAKIGGAGYLLGAVVSSIAGWLSDFWIRCGGTPTLVRKTFVGGGVAVCGSILCISAFIPDRTMSVVVLLVGMACWGFPCSNLWAITQTLAGPRAAGRWTGFQNCVGNMAGVVVPVLTGEALRLTGHFSAAFVAVAAVAIMGCLTWIFVVGRIEQVDWDAMGSSEATRAVAAD
ncbi:MAG TPA: MFS transporter [Candidatus Koribacter sp.]|jgi:MFS family permease